MYVSYVGNILAVSTSAIKILIVFLMQLLIKSDLELQNKYWFRFNLKCKFRSAYSKIISEFSPTFTQITWYIKSSVKIIKIASVNYMKNI